MSRFVHPNRSDIKITDTIETGLQARDLIEHVSMLLVMMESLVEKGKLAVKKGCKDNLQRKFKIFNFQNLKSSHKIMTHGYAL